MTGITGPGATDASLDPKAGGTYRDKPIWDVTTIEDNLNRTGYDWYHNNYGELNDGVLSYGFWSDYRELAESYYVNEDGTIGFNEAYYAGDFSPFNAGQIAVAQTAIGLWDDLIDIRFVQTFQYRAADADIVYGNTYTGGAQAYAYLPFGSTIDEYYQDNYGFEQAGRLSGDVWIDGFVASNFFPLTNSYYATTTMIHETGHALGLSHPGNYNALDPDGNPVPVTYEAQAEYAQDSLQYSIMSYFDGYETGAQFIDFQLLNFAYPSTPMIHDIAAIQAIYGADYTTRAGDTVYGFNTTEAGTAYDFTSNTRPVLSIWDGAGEDTIDVSGYKTPSLINLNAGSFSSVGGADHFYTLDEINAARAAAGLSARTQATYDYYQDLIKSLGITNPLFHDNLSIAYGVTIENAIGGKGDDKIIANDVANIIEGGRGNDTVSYEESDRGVTVSLARGDAAMGTGYAAGDSFKSIENVMGSDFDDKLFGNRFANVLTGGKGDDVLVGRGGADTFAFRTEAQSTGHDVIRDFGGNDVIGVTRQLTANADGIVEVNGGTLVLDSRDGDSVTFKGDGADAGLRFVGKVDNYYYYAAADSDVTTASIKKLATPAESMEEAAAKEKAMIEAAKAPTDVNLANRADGWTEASPTTHGSTNGGFGEHVDASKALPAGAFAGERSAAFHAPVDFAHTGGLHTADLHLAVIA